MSSTQPLVNNRLALADGLRGFAALWVVLFHLAEGRHLESLRAATPTFLFSAVFEWGHLGVAVFFVLSGFVMGLSAYKLVFSRENALRFVGRRLLRLAPPYYFAVIFCLLFLFIKSRTIGGEYAPTDLKTLLHHVFFAQGFFGSPHINVVFWTLCIEVQFYVAFALLLWACDAFARSNNSSKVRAIVVSAAFVLALLWPLRVIHTTFWQGGFIEFWYSFLVGVMVCWAGLLKKTFLKLTFVAILVLLAIGLIYQSSFVVAASLTAITLLIAGIYNQMGNWLNWAWLQWIGVVSYSLYLLHNPITGATANIVKRFVNSGVPGDLLVIATSLSACLVVAYLCYLFIERPSIKLSHLIKFNRLE